MLILFIVLIIAIQLAIGHLMHKNGIPLKLSILLMFLPLGIGVFLLQIFHYERKYPNWEVPFQVKIRLKYIYLLTLLEFILLYLIFSLFIAH
ncbi:hypothetical protein [Staphylococcus massiliensis]|uniref:Uncharacterized protein n=1 Tax=Staphylococcus massiliensis S46 TaxID=1229783 RepID=K9AMG8_9STAP|nr:hypothetical protein [Staphylococcus massiliensis]EKU48583.1 hypothetical protein C273_05220 [Staphylococcus massiliensis S46]MCG3400228.1 hypothetical protein [Staphylococcus massiliensis]MCG3401859.1 hypothetical protein [Staphylococcus massiliensis]MCG3413111.1 hypothetical protein [Staphylococcus massiliensis]PNZ98476.1 hypothetical protein CD133_08690 [Staphylococcus massiliensis CCUG 55927]